MAAAFFFLFFFFFFIFKRITSQVLINLCWHTLLITFGSYHLLCSALDGFQFCNILSEVGRTDGNNGVVQCVQNADRGDLHWV